MEMKYIIYTFYGKDIMDTKRFYGAGVNSLDLNINISMTLGSHSSIFQCECVAITEAATSIKGRGIEDYGIRILTTKDGRRDVLALQNNRRERRLPDYRSAPGHSLATNFIFECGIKLGLQPASVATAAFFYHKFFKEADKNDYDCYVICTACLCAAGKSRDEPVRLRDAVNVAQNSFNRGAGPLELGDEYWSWRGSVAQAELLVLRLLGFNLDAPSPHRYLLHYLRSLQEWFPAAQWRSAPIARTAMAFLQDFHHSASVLDYRAPHIAVASLTLALHVLGVSVPLAATLDDDAAWYSLFLQKISKKKKTGRLWRK